MNTLITRRRWTPVTEVTLSFELDAAYTEYGCHPRWPVGWFLWQTARITRDARAIRATMETTR